MNLAPALDSATASAIREAMTAIGMGNFDRARTIAETALARGGDRVALNAMLGALYLRKGDAASAIAHLQAAYALRTEDLKIAINLATALAETGAYEQALEVASPDAALNDRSGTLQRIRAFALQSSGKYCQAAKAYECLVASDPNDWESWNNLGNSRRADGALGGAVQALRSAAQLAPEAAPVRLNLALALADSGDVKAAEVELRSMIRDFPSDANPCRELYLVMRSQAREDDALEAIEEASRRSPEDLELLLAVASQRLLVLDNAGAEAAYRAAIARDPKNGKANFGLALVYELSNRTAELGGAADAAQGRGAASDVVHIIRAFDLRRQRRFEEALAEMRTVSPDFEPARQAHLRGQLHEGSGNYPEAWRQYCRMNEVQREDRSQPELRAQQSRRAIRQNHDATTADWAERWTKTDPAVIDFQPVFLVGFPRSGTTLLDTLLLGHPDVLVLEEEPTLTEPSKIFGDYQSLPDASAEIVELARRAYVDDVQGRVPSTRGKLIVDKNPLMMAALPLIYRLFPEARVILAVRDPRDCVFSCFTTNFKLNDAMSNFLRLDTTAELYDLVFQYFQKARGLLPIAVHQLAYEDVVANPEASMRALIEFVGIPWRDSVLDHQHTAASRGRVKTASYAQITEPIYTRSTGRSRHFQSWLEPITPIIHPWIEKLGYTEK